MEKGNARTVQTEKLQVKYEDDKLFIGENPQLVVDLKTQNNYIEVDDRKIPYHREIQLSKDLLEGKRANVFQTAVNHYYKQACSVAEGVLIAEKYRSKANRTVREVK